MYRELIMMRRKLDSNQWCDQKEERNIQPEKNEETRILKNEQRIRNLQDILKRSQHLNYRGARRRRGRTKN